MRRFKFVRLVGVVFVMSSLSAGCGHHDDINAFKDNPAAYKGKSVTLAPVYSNVQCDPNHWMPIYSDRICSNNIALVFVPPKMPVPKNAPTDPLKVTFTCGGKLESDNFVTSISRD